MTDTADTAVSSPLAAENLQVQQSDARSESAVDNVWRALGHYAIGELSVGHTQNALYAYRLLCALEPSEARWKLGRAFCALNLRRLVEAQKVLDAVLETSRLTSPGQEKLLHQCRERIAYLQRQKSTAPRPQGKDSGNGGKVLRFPNALHS